MTTSNRRAARSRWLAAVALITASVMLIAGAVAAFADPPRHTDGTGRALGYWEAYEEGLTFAPYTEKRTDGTGRAIGYWKAYEKEQAFAPYTEKRTDGTGRAIGYWKAYQKAQTR